MVLSHAARHAVVPPVQTRRHASVAGSQVRPLAQVEVPGRQESADSSQSSPTVQAAPSSQVWTVPTHAPLGAQASP